MNAVRVPMDDQIVEEQMVDEGPQISTIVVREVHNELLELAMRKMQWQVLYCSLRRATKDRGFVDMCNARVVDKMNEIVFKHGVEFRPNRVRLTRSMQPFGMKAKHTNFIDSKYKQMFAEKRAKTFGIVLDRWRQKQSLKSIVARFRGMSWQDVVDADDEPFSKKQKPEDSDLFLPCDPMRNAGPFPSGF